MTSRIAVTAPVRVALRSVCLIAVAVGIFGMHVLANCGVGVGGMTSMAGMPMAAVTQMADPNLSAAREAVVVDHLDMASVVRDVVTVRIGPVGDDGGMGMSMIEWCLAVIVLGLGALLYFRRHRWGRPTWLFPRFARLFATIERTGRHLPALSLSQLSLLRC